MRKALLALVLSGLLLSYSCREEEASPKPSLESINVPEGFTWENSREVSFSIGVSDTQYRDAVHLISIYDGDPLAGASLISSGAASLTQSFNVRIALSLGIKSVYVVKIAPDGSVVTEKVEVSTNNVTLSMGAKATGKAVASAVTDGAASTMAEPNCTKTIVTSGNYNIDSEGQVLCVRGSNISVAFNFNASGTVRITGTNVRVEYANLNGSSKMTIASGASVNAGGINLNGAATQLENNGSLIFDGVFSPGGVFTNNGELTVKGDFNLNGSSAFTNNGVIGVWGSLNFGSGAVGLNGGKITMNDSFKLNSGTFINNCMLYAKNEYHNNGIMKNYSYIRADKTSYLNSGELGLYNNAMFSTGNIYVNNRIAGYGATSLVKVSGNSTINSSTVSGAVQYCDANGIETNNGTFSGGARLGCDAYIPVSSCNTEGNGAAPVVDKDGDGVSDLLDAYPEDASKAFNNYYPSSSANAASTLAFEDTWPSRGDYDLNDVVISYRYQVVTNAQNQVVHVDAFYKLLASGGTFRNGFAVEFPVNRGDVSGLVGGTLESGQAKAVVAVFSDSRNEQARWNTKPGEELSPAKSYSVSFDVAGKPLLSVFGLSAYNPFIWNQSLGRGIETHLPGKTPTTLASNSYFGTADDRTGNGKYYVSDKGLPWGIDIPVASFSYPSEGNDISAAYLHFAGWAASGGSVYSDWFSNTISGYRNSDKLFN